MCQKLLIEFNHAAKITCILLCVFLIFITVLITVNLRTSFRCLEHVLLYYFAGISSLTLILLKHLKIVTCSKTLKMPAFLCNLFSHKNSQWHSLRTIHKWSRITYIDFGLIHHRLHSQNIAEITSAKFMFISPDCQNG